MKIALIGASGFIGSALREEALHRGHQVTALVSQPGKLNATASNLTVAQVDVQDTAQLTDTLTGADVVISAFSGHAQDDIRGYYVQGVKSIIAAVKAADVARLLIVGGAGSLRVAADTLLIDTPAFPEEYKPTALGAQDALALLEAEQVLNWAMLSPAAEIFPGERTEQFRLGNDDLLVDDQGNSRISVQDYAVALLDEVDHPQHERERFTLAY
ncbi:MAG: NAD(P)-dependent oxidoreductase [Alcanivorax jadensis]|uniref:NAD(P)-dependent oxidoreductase n=1 Tax=Alcanivorax jadensis TaxID=64988 RepID=UPI003002C622